MDGIKFSIVLPSYNEGPNLPGLLERYTQVWEDLPAELILVDNGSTDDTPETLERLLGRSEFGFCRSIRVARNRGYGHGIASGLTEARGEYVGFSHADQQCDPADVFRAYHELTASLAADRTVVKGRRAPRPAAQELVTNVMSGLSTMVLVTKLTDINAQPKVFHRDLLGLLTDPPDGFQFDLYVLYTGKKAGYDIRTIPVVFGERVHGESKWAATLFGRYKTILATILYIFKLRLGKR